MVIEAPRIVGAAPARAVAWAQTQRGRFVDELMQLIRFPTVSAQPSCTQDMRHCAHWLAEHLGRIGLERVRELRSPGPPIVFAEWRRAPGRPTVLVYGHYDVQPPDPLAEWRSPPFTPTLRGDDLYARGASDDKGQMLALVMALEAWLRATRGLPVNVTCLLEGEEEIGSPSLVELLRRSPEPFAADAAVVSDTQMLAPDRPAITSALRGALGLELEVRGPRRDVHSGRFGGAIHNPLQALAEILASLHDPAGRVAIPGFYQRVRRMSDAERISMARTGPRDVQILRDAGAARGWGEAGFSLYERTTIRPALTINGVVGGYGGPGTKSVIPASALAKIGVRLVPDQDPREIDRLIREHIGRATPPAVRSLVRSSGWARPAVVDLFNPAIRAASAAYRRGFGAEPVFVRSGGTIPVVAAIQETLGIPVALMGFALPDDRIHAPNEKVHLPNLFRGITTAVWFLQYVANRVRPYR